MERGPELDFKYFCRFADYPDFGGQSNVMTWFCQVLAHLLEANKNQSED
jgi:hypothetical protein